MKTGPLLAGFLTLLCACNNAASSDSPEADSSSAVHVQERAWGVPDSFQRAQAQVAYGDLKFGATEDDFLHTSVYQKIGTADYFFLPAYNAQGQLYLLTIRGDKQPASRLNTVVAEEVENLKQMISDKYGPPQFTYPNPTILDFKPGFIQWMYEWTVFTKKIKIGILEEAIGSAYHSDAWIYSEPMYLDAEKENQRAADSARAQRPNNF